jgi:hypothetical protein
MGRIVTAVITHGGVCAGVVGPFPVEVPWWAQVEPVVAHLEQTLGVPVVVLRLLAVEGSDGARDGHVTYHAEALQPPANLPPRPAQDLEPIGAVRPADGRWPALAQGHPRLRGAEPAAIAAFAQVDPDLVPTVVASEHVYHLGDPAASIRQAIACAAAPDVS